LESRAEEENKIMAIEDEEASTNNPTTTTAKTISKFTIVVQAQDNSMVLFFPLDCFISSFPCLPILYAIPFFEFI